MSKNFNFISQSNNQETNQYFNQSYSQNNYSFLFQSSNKQSQNSQSSIKSIKSNQSSISSLQMFQIIQKTQQQRLDNASYTSSNFDYSRLFDSEVKQNKTTSPKRMIRLKKMKQQDNKQCAICLQDIQNEIILSCNHKFCYKCLHEWFQTSTTCPYCRKSVLSYWKDGQQILIQPKQYEHHDENGQNFDWICYRCEHMHQGDIVLICDNCQAYACHITCDESLNGIQPQGNWYCHYCR